MPHICAGCTLHHCQASLALSEAHRQLASLGEVICIRAIEEWVWRKGLTKAMREVCERVERGMRGDELRPDYSE